MFARIYNLEATRIVLIYQIDISEEDPSKNVTSDDHVPGHSGEAKAVTCKSIVEFSLSRIINNFK